MSNNEESAGVKERIKARLLEATDEESLRLIRQELKDQGEKPGSIDAVVSELRKKGHLKFGGARGDFYPVKIGKSEIIPPEQALAHIRLQDGDYKLGFVDGMSTLIMAARYNQLLAASQAEILSNQLTIMKEAARVAQGGALEAASVAGEAAAGGVAKFFMDTKPWLATAQNPMQAMMMDTMRPFFQQIMGQMIGGLIRPVPPGAHPGQGQPSQGQPEPSPGQGAKFQPMSDQERKDIFGGEG